MTLRLGNLTFDSHTFMAPMEGITDVPFRRTVRAMGAGVVCTPMIHVEAVLRRGNEPRVREVIAIDPCEGPVGVQLCGSTPDAMAEAARAAEDAGAAFVDINMGCPSPTVVGRGAGAALLRNGKIAAALVRAVRAGVSVPVTVKMRSGWDERCRGALDTAPLIEEAGADLLTVHGRSRAQKYSGRADWDLIREVKEKLRIPVVGNGDVFTHADIARMQKTTNVDGVMVARGALGNPWIFSGERPPPVGILPVLSRHLDLHLAFYGDLDRALLLFRKHIAWYTRRLVGGAEFRRRVFSEKSLQKTIGMIEEFFSTTSSAESRRATPD